MKDYVVRGPVEGVVRDAKLESHFHPWGPPIAFTGFSMHLEGDDTEYGCLVPLRVDKKERVRMYVHDAKREDWADASNSRPYAGILSIEFLDENGEAKFTYADMEFSKDRTKMKTDGAREAEVPAEQKAE